MGVPDWVQVKKIYDSIDKWHHVMGASGPVTISLRFHLLLTRKR